MSSKLASAAQPVEAEQRTTPVELLWDLVFVFAITQVTTLLTASLSWAGFGRAMLVLALVWWAWSAFVWAANAQTATSPTLPLVLLPATGFIFVAGLTLPRAFSSEAALFTVCYAVVRFLHLALYADASRRGNASWAAIAGFALTVVVGMALLITGAFLTGAARISLWTAAVAIDYAGPAWLTRDRLRGLQRVAVAHFAERYGLFVIICLGESIVAVGAAALGGQAGAARKLSLELVAAVGLCLLSTVGMWWLYFERWAERAERRLREHHDPVLAAADGYSYLHLPLVAGVIVFAVGAKILLRAPAHPLAEAARLSLCGGVALYLMAHLAFVLRLEAGARAGGRVVHLRGRLVAGVHALHVVARSVTAAALMVLFVVGGSLAGWAVAAVIVVLLAALCAIESLALPRFEGAGVAG